jgi:hypothetical protein
VKRWPSLLCAPLFSPKGYLLWAGSFAIIFAAVHLAGLRRYASAISLTVPEGTSIELGTFWCILYLAFYLLVIVLCPVLVLGAGLLALFLRLPWATSGD